MSSPNDLTLLENGLKELGFVEDDTYLFWNKTVWARIEGRVVIFGVDGMQDEERGALAAVNFEPVDVMEAFHCKQGIQSLENAFQSVRKKAENYVAALRTYTNKIVAYFVERGVPVVCKMLNDNSTRHVTIASIQIAEEAQGGKEVVELFRVNVRYDFGMEFIFEDEHSIIVDGDDFEHNMFLLFDEDLLNIKPENPVDRVDYSAAYHYRYIVNSLHDMLRVGVKKVWKETCNIVTALDKPVTNCNKHFRPEVIGTITDFSVTFKSSIHQIKKRDEQ